MNHLFLFLAGLATLVVGAELVVSRQVIRQEVPIVVGASLLLLVVAGDGTIGRLETGAMFVLPIAAFTLAVLAWRARFGGSQASGA